MATPTSFDKSNVFVEKLCPIIAQLDKICAEEKIPYFLTIATANNADGTHYENSARSPAPMGVELSDDIIINHVKVSAGFEVILPDSLPEIEL